MKHVAQAIMTGRLSPFQACQNIDMTEAINRSENVEQPGWLSLRYSFQIIRDHIYIVVDYAHDSSIDRAQALIMLRLTMRNLVNWSLLGQAISSGVTIEMVSDELMVKYEGDTAWGAHIAPPDDRGDLLATGSTEAIQLGVSWLGFILQDPGLLYALQDYSSALHHPNISLFFLYRAVEWIMWEYDERGHFDENPNFNHAANALGLPLEWILQIGRLAHAYTRHARLRGEPEPRLIEAATKRVQFLILRYINVKHKGVKFEPVELPNDYLTDWELPGVK